MRYQQLSLYVLVLVSVTFVLISALGGGTFNQQEHWLLQWQHQMFSNICHQNPERSLWMNGQPMAVCSRCLGIYFSLWIGWLLLPFSSRITYITTGKAKKILAVIIFFNIVDVVGNSYGLWHNTLYSRLVLGILLGGTAVQLFSGDFFNINYN